MTIKTRGTRRFLRAFAIFNSLNVVNMLVFQRIIITILNVSCPHFTPVGRACQLNN